MSVPSVFQGDDGGPNEAQGPSRGVESLSGSPSSMMICRRSVCVRRGGLAGEDSVGCRWGGGGGGGEDSLLLWGKGVTRLRGVGWGPGCFLCIGGDASVVAFSDNKKAYKAASPSLMMRMCVGPCGEGANWTRRLVSGGGRSAVLGLPLGRFVAVAVSRRVVGTLPSRLVMDVMTKPCNCCC